MVGRGFPWPGALFQCLVTSSDERDVVGSSSNSSGSSSNMPLSASLQGDGFCLAYELTAPAMKAFSPFLACYYMLCICHIVDRCLWNVNVCRYICLDEGDRMLDMGFDEEVCMLYIYLLIS